MFFLLGAIVGLVAAGCLVAHVVILTVKWIKNKIKEKLAKKNVKKVAIADLDKLIEECGNTMSLDELEELSDEGYSQLMVDVDYNNEIVGDVELIKDENDYLDEEVEQLLGKKGMLVVEA